MIHTSLLPHQPIGLCVSGFSTLLYLANDPPVVHWLDCSTVPPKILTGTHIIHIQQNQVWDMQYATIGNKELLITTDNVNHGIYAYDTNTDELMWHMKGKVAGMRNELWAEGVTTDGCGVLFVCGRNNGCVQKFSVSDGTYLGSLPQEFDLEEPRFVRWHDDTSSLVVSHARGNNRYLSVINPN